MFQNESQPDCGRSTNFSGEYILTTTLMIGSWLTWVVPCLKRNRLYLFTTLEKSYYKNFTGQRHPPRAISAHIPPYFLRNLSQTWWKVYWSGYVDAKYYVSTQSTVIIDSNLKTIFVKLFVRGQELIWWEKRRSVIIADIMDVSEPHVALVLTSHSCPK